jgi:hypothetical protein
LLVQEKLTKEKDARRVRLILRSAALVPAPADAAVLPQRPEADIVSASLSGASPKSCGARAHPTGFKTRAANRGALDSPARMTGNMN